MVIATHTSITAAASIDRPEPMLPKGVSVATSSHAGTRPGRRQMAFHILITPSALRDYQSGADLFDSIKAQSFGHWMLALLADDADEAAIALELVRHYAAADSRITPALLPSGMLHERLHALDDGAFVVLIDRPGRLAQGALWQFAESIAKDRDLILLYGDETCPTETERAARILAKPAFDRETLHDDVVGSVVAAAASTAAACAGMKGKGTLRERLLQIMARPMAYGLTSAQIAHVPGIAFHRLEPQKLQAPSQLHRRPARSPAVTAIIPTRDRADLLRMTLDGLMQKTHYPCLDVVVIDNGSVDEDALALMDSLDPGRTRVLRRNIPFNFARLNNEAARHARGEILLFLNNDIEVLDPDWLHALVAAVEEPGVGAAGALLLYPDHTIQHAGVVLGANGAVAAHVGAHEREEWLTQTFGTGKRRVSALTAACMAVPRRVFHEMGGFDERLAVAYNDVDFCLRLGAAGYRCVFTPEARLIHHESATRASDTAPENRERAFQEERLMRELWGTWLFDDPFFPQAYGLSPLETVSDGTPRRSPILAKLT